MYSEFGTYFSSSSLFKQTKSVLSSFKGTKTSFFIYPLIQRIDLEPRIADLSYWKRICHHNIHLEAEGETVTIAVIGKYTGLQDSYLSVIKALQHAASFADRKLKISWVEASTLEVYKLPHFSYSFRILKKNQMNSGKNLKTQMAF